MTIVFFGVGGAPSWAAAILNSLAGPGTASLELVIIECPLQREQIVALFSRHIDVLVLVDHEPILSRWVDEKDLPSDLKVRQEAQRAVLGLELARRAEQTIFLSSADANDSVVRLAQSIGYLPSTTFIEPLLHAPNEPIVTALKESFLKPLFAAAGRQRATISLSWPPEAFLDGDAPGTVMPLLIEIAGRARIVAYGPYLPLPSGPWQVTVFLGFSADIGKMPFILEIDSGSTVTRGFFEVEQGGIFSLDLKFEVTDPFCVVELRLITQDSALDGQTALIDVCLEQSI